jgi:3(or 17)beta-hydroxysteroid dehydrogenase
VTELGKLNGKIALVTGGGQGIGRAIALRLFKEGASVIVGDIIGASRRSFGPHAEYFDIDVTRPADWKKVINHIDDAYGRFDVLVNNAGISPAGSILDTDYDTWMHVQRINSDGCFLGCKHAVEYMKGRGGGAIVNISSIVPLRGGGDLVAYSASKAAVTALTRSVAINCGPLVFAVIRCILAGSKHECSLSIWQTQKIRRQLERL